MVTGQRRSLSTVTLALIGFLVLVELTSGILQGYYVPLISDLVKHLGIHDADFNWFEAGQLLLSAIVVPILAKLGDMYGHKRMLLISTALTALASWGLLFAGNFTAFLIAWTLQGFYTVWLPLEVALIFDRGRRSGSAASTTRRAAGLLVVALELGAIAGALGAGALFEAFGGNVPLTLSVPAIAVTLVFFVILFGVPESEPVPGRRLDTLGFVLLTLSLLTITGGLSMLRGASDPVSGPMWLTFAIALIVLGVLVLLPFGLWELRHKDPAIDLRVLRQPNMWPVQITAGLFGISVLGAQIPLSTFAGTDPENGYGLGLSSGQRSILIGVYLISMIAGALLFAFVSRFIAPRIALIAAAFLVATGYLLFLPFHDSVAQVITNMLIAGLGSGALVAALPAAAAAAAPRGQTGISAGLTNTTKTIGGAFASAVFGIVLLQGVTQAAGTAASLSGYMTVWAVCGGGALVAAVLLFFVPKLAFSDADVAPEAVAEPVG